MDPASPRSNSGAVVGPRDIVDLGKRKIYFVAGFVLVCALLLAAIIPPMNDTYTASAALVLERDDTQVLETVIKLTEEERDRAALDTEIDVMSSRVFVGQVVDEMKLMENPWFNTFLAARSDKDEQNAIERLLDAAWSELFDLLGIEREEDGPSLPSKTIQHDRTITSFLQSFEASKTPNSFVVTVHVTTPDPELSAKLANAVVERYVAWSRELRQEAAREAIDFLRDRASELASRIARSERAITTFTRVNELAPDKRDDLLRARVVELNAQRTAAWVELAEIRAGRIHEGTALDEQADADGTTLDSPLLKTLEAEQARLIKQRANYASNFGAAHPRLAETEAELASVARMIDEELGRIAQEQFGEEGVVIDRIGQLESQISGIRATLRDHGLAEIRLRELERDLLGDQKLHQRVVARQGGLDPIATLAKGRARVISAAAVPLEANFPRKMHLLVGGVIGSALLALILAVLLEAADTRIRSDQTLAEVTELPNLATMPKLPRRLLKRPAETPCSIAAEAFRSLRLALRAAVPEAGGIVLVAAPLPRSGTTTVAFGLALAAARDGAKALYIEFRAQAGPLAALARAVKDGVADEAALEATGRVRSVGGQDCLHTLAEAGSGGEASRGLEAHELRLLLRRLRDVYDLIVIDAAPVLLVEDASWLSPLVDAEVLVVRFATTREEALADAVSRLRLSGAPLVGTVLNAVRSRGRPRDVPLVAVSYPRQARAYFSG